MHGYDLIKSRGKSRANPDRARSWKEYQVERKNADVNYRRIAKKAFHRNARRQTISEDDDDKPHGFVQHGRCSIKEWYYEMSTKSQPLKEAQLLRSGRYCLRCGRLFCHHRVEEVALILLERRKRRIGAFAYFPTEIVLMIAQFSYQAGLQWLALVNQISGVINFTGINDGYFAPSAINDAHNRRASYRSF